MIGFEEFSLNESKEHKKLIFYHGVKDPKNVETILARGFSLFKVNPIWTNDWAISVVTTVKAVKDFFGNKKITILKLEFDGNIIDRDELGNIIASSPQDYTHQVVDMGIDAVRLAGDFGQAFIYNPKAIKKITVVE